LGLSSNGQIQVLTGLNGTEQVVLEGIDRLAEGKKFKLFRINLAMATSKPAVG
jgi:multidrug efflux system membrane fusion protein